MFSEKGRLEVGPTSYPQSFLCVLCALCANPVFNLWSERKPRYRAVAKRKSAYAAMPVLSVLSVFSVRTLFFRAVAKRRDVYVAMTV